MLYTVGGTMVICGAGLVAYWVIRNVPFPLNAGIVILLLGLILSTIGEARK